MKPDRGYPALRRGRFSQIQASYFLTFCTAERTAGLNECDVATCVRAELAACETDGHWRVRGAVIMPDHIHLLVQLTGALALGRIVGRVKARTRSVLQTHGLRWQGDFYEHRMRPDDPVGAVLRYMLLNPLRSGMANVGEDYPWFWLHPDDHAWFEPTLDEGKPFPEWLA